MQDRYVGDVGDFAKYALLRSLVGNSELRLGIVWCLFGDESHNGDGRHIGYLEQPEFLGLDSILHDRLSRIVKSGRRSVARVVNSNIFPEGAISFRRRIGPFLGQSITRIDREKRRSIWLSRALATTQPCDLVFFDPDNGFETSSVPKHSPKAGKYIFMDELSPFWQRGQSLVVYHHLNRTASVKEQTRILRDRIGAHFREPAFIRPMLFRRGSCRHFWILSQPRHALELDSRINKMLTSGWGELFEVC